MQSLLSIRQIVILIRVHAAPLRPPAPCPVVVVVGAAVSPPSSTAVGGGGGAAPGGALVLRPILKVQHPRLRGWGGGVGVGVISMPSLTRRGRGRKVCNE